MQSYSLSSLLLFSLLSPALSAAPLACPLDRQSPAEQSSWRAEASQGLAAGSLSQGTVASRLESCFGSEVPACMDRLEAYVHRTDIAPPSADPGVAGSPAKQPPRELLVPGRSGTYFIPEDIEAIAAAREWPAVRYKSRHAGGFDPETPSLLMVYVPGDKVEPPVPYDRWLNFALPRDQGAEALIPEPQAPISSADDYAAERSGGPQLPRTFTMVSLKRARTDAPAEVFFQKFYRSQLGSPFFVPEPSADLKTCIGCHPNGLRAIAPLGYHVKPGEMQLTEEARQSVALINKAMLEAAGNKPVTWREVQTASGEKKKLLSPEGYGPFVGPLQALNGLSRSREFILGGRLPDGSETAGCYRSRSTVDVRDIFGRAPGASSIYRLSSSPSIRWEKVRDAMKCSACHNNVSRGALNSLTRWDQVDFKILVDRSMPFGYHGDPLDEGSLSSRDSLTLDERIALANCLKEEFAREQRELAKWLTQATCR